MNNEYERLKEWREERQLQHKGFTGTFVSIVEEVVEGLAPDIKSDEARELANTFVQKVKKMSSEDCENPKNVESVLDALTDARVYAINGTELAGFSAEVCIHETITEISSREGAYDESIGKWKKDPNQDPNTLYTADFTKALLPLKPLKEEH